MSDKKNVIKLNCSISNDSLLPFLLIFVFSNFRPLIMTEFCDNSLIDQFKTSINKIYQNSIDIVELTSIARKFQINIASDEFSLQKRKVLRFLLNHVTRETDEEKYISMLQETESWFRFHQSSSTIQGYECIYTGCIFMGKNHRDYVRKVLKLIRSYKKNI